MNVRAVVTGVVGAAVIAIAVLSITGGASDPYLVRMSLSDASGLRNGADVRLGGATVGTIDSIKLSRSDAVEVMIGLTKDGAKIGRGASAAIRSTNLLGEKFVQLEAGDAQRPLPSGSWIPRAKVIEPVDLDQVIDVLDADTRTRLQILVNEAGAAFSGRSGDFAALLERLPRTLQSGTQVVDQLTDTNQQLGQLVDRSDSFLARLTPQRAALGDLVGEAASALQGTTDRREQLGQTLDRAPETLRSAQRFLGELERTTVPLGPAARALTATAPTLLATLDQVKPFEQAAKPTLDQARSIAPTLTRLGVKATPTIKQAVPTLKRLTGLAQATPPLVQALGDKPAGNDPPGIDGLLTALEGWGRATQGRDGIGHVFRGHFAISSDLFKSLLGRLSPNAASDRKKTSPTTSAPVKKAAAGGTTDAPATPAPAPTAQDPLNKIISGLVPKVTNTVPPPSNSGSVKDLLDYLLKP